MAEWSDASKFLHTSTREEFVIARVDDVLLSNHLYATLLTVNNIFD